MCENKKENNDSKFTNKSLSDKRLLTLPIEFAE